MQVILDEQPRLQAIKQHPLLQFNEDSDDDIHEYGEEILNIIQKDGKQIFADYLADNGAKKLKKGGPNG